MSPRCRARARPSGFTLIEVLMALTIVSIALAAIVRASSQSITHLGRLEKQSLAMLSAENRLAELRIGSAPASPGVLRTPCPQGEVPLLCRLEVGAAAGGLRNATVEVYLAGDAHSLASLQTRIEVR